MPRTRTADQFDLAGQIQIHRVTFVLYPVQWMGYSYPRPLDWSVLPFIAASQASLPDAPGVYAFLVQPKVAPELNGSYIVYVGETDSLRRRYGDYLREAEGGARSRTRLYAMFRRFTTHLHFAFAPVPLNERKEAEAALLSALIPPANSKLPADISRPVRAFSQ